MLHTPENRAGASKSVYYFTPYSISVYFDFFFFVFHFALIIEDVAIMPSTKKRCKFHQSKKRLKLLPFLITYVFTFLILSARMVITEIF